MSDNRLNSLTRLALVNSGSTEIVVFDNTEKRYHIFKGVTISSSSKVIERLKSTFGEDCVVLK